jgi:hypothetical protein
MTPHEKEIKYLRGLVRRLIKEGWVYSDHEICVFCTGLDGNGFENTRRHADYCVGNEARKYLLKKREA